MNPETLRTIRRNDVRHGSVKTNDVVHNSVGSNFKPFSTLSASNATRRIGDLQMHDAVPLASDRGSP